MALMFGRNERTAPNARKKKVNRWYFRYEYVIILIMLCMSGVRHLSPHLWAAIRETLDKRFALDNTVHCGVLTLHPFHFLL